MGRRRGVLGRPTHHHYLSEAMTLRPREAVEPFGVRVNLDGREEGEAEDTRFVAAGE
ncbi:hypothetical protein [Streptomyces sp. NPDC059894]|uniref:hypothetical protein n=1 Tax=unclassified Streptomyces TaxID=2593676 RepID=UPI00365E9008